MSPLLILITGLPGSGKTTLARKIVDEFHFPLIARDDIKEQLFDTLGWSDRAWSRKLGIASYSILYFTLEKMLQAGISCIVESNFRSENDNLKMQELQKRYGARIIQIICTADGKVLLQRFKDRAESGQRHPGHVDQTNYDEFSVELLNAQVDQLQVEGSVIEIDTTKPEEIDYSSLFASVRSALST
ncbi:MAG: ATP-binding protein [Candidatus Nomurabacteria bacterium]|nr:MAG: ATP-binding protein [Candidatus Nomurabacteria bacterium]